MHDLPVSQTVVEIIQSYLQSVVVELRDEIHPSLGIDIKSKKRLDKKHDECRVFYIRVSTRPDLDICKLLQDDSLAALKEVLLFMQSEDEDGHLSTQRQQEMNPGCVLQEVFWLEKQDSRKLTVKTLHKKELTVIDIGTFSFVCHFRVVQRESHMIREVQLIHRYIHKLKLLNNQVSVAFSTKICGITCQTDFSVRGYLQGKEVSFVDDLTFFFGNECLKSTYSLGARQFAGRTFTFHPESGSSPQLPSLNVTCIACMFPILERYPDSRDFLGITGQIIINLYGPMSVPLMLSNNQLEDLTIPSLMDWSRLGLSLSPATETRIQGDLRSMAHVGSRRNLPLWASEATTFLLCAVIMLDSGRAEEDIDQELLAQLQSHALQWRQLSTAIGKSLESTLKPVFTHRPTEHQRMRRQTYMQFIKMSSSGIGDIFNHSTNAQFRHDIGQLLGLGEGASVKPSVEKMLISIADIEVGEVENDDADICIDDWDTTNRPMTLMTWTQPTDMPASNEDLDVLQDHGIESAASRLQELDVHSTTSAVPRDQSGLHEPDSPVELDVHNVDAADVSDVRDPDDSGDRLLLDDMDSGAQLTPEQESLYSRVSPELRFEGSMNGESDWEEQDTDIAARLDAHQQNTVPVRNAPQVEHSEFDNWLNGIVLDLEDWL